MEQNAEIARNKMREQGHKEVDEKIAQLTDRQILATYEYFLANEETKIR